MDEYKKLLYREKISQTADNMKMSTIGILVVSLVVFTHIGEEAAKSIVLYWAGGMLLLLVINLLLDYKISIKMRDYKDGKLL